MDLSIGKTWNACVFVIESPRGRSAKRPRRIAPRYLSRSAPQGLSITKTHKHSTLENGDIVLSNFFFFFFFHFICKSHILYTLEELKNILGTQIR